MLVFDKVSKSFGKHTVLTNCSFSLPARSVWALTGPNGAGKTTTLRLAAGLEGPSKGQILAEGHDVQAERESVRHLVGFSPDVPFAYEFLTGREFLQFVGRLWELPKTAVEDRTHGLLTQMCLDQMLDRPVREYSRGMRQKLGFVVAILHQPRLLLLDEPFTAVDLESRKVMLQWLYDFAMAGGSVLFATHDEELIRQLAQRVVHIVDHQFVISIVENALM